MALMRSDLQHRNASVTDPLTSMLNRNALRTRVDELSYQASILRQPIGVIVGDLDHFKEINDNHGHAVGDAVLRDVAYTLRKRRAHSISPTASVARSSWSSCPVPTRASPPPSPRSSAGRSRPRCRPASR